MGFTLVEIVAAIAIAGLLMAAMVGTLVRQQRFFSSAAAIIGVRTQLRDGAEALASDIRGAAAARFDIASTGDSAIEFMATIATSIACTRQGMTGIGLPPQLLARGNTLTSMLFLPDTGDLALLYSIPSGIADSGRWDTRRIASFGARPVSSACPPATGFTTAQDGSSGSPAYLVTLTEPPGPEFRPGAPVVFVRRVRYSLYRSVDGNWYLGYRRCGVGTAGCAAIQPVSGPYRSYTPPPGPSGIAFRFYDETGAELAAVSRYTARIDVVLRGQTARAASLAGDARRAYRDSVILTVSPRNRR